MKQSHYLARFAFPLLISASLFALTACGGGGGESTPAPTPPKSSSSISSASSSSVIPRPNTPTSLDAANIGSTKVTLVWNASNGEVPASGYRLTRNGQVIGTTDGAVTSYTDTDLAPNNQYTYRVQAGDANGNWSSLSTSLSVRTAPPGNDWDDNPPSSASSSSSSSSSVRSSSSSRVSSSRRSSSSRSSTGTISSQSSSVASSIASSVSSTSSTGPDTSAPSVPADLRATAVKDTSVDLTWDASFDNVAVTRYRISRNGETVATVSGQSHAYLDMDLTPNTQYTYRVQAGDASGNWSTFSSPLQVTTLGVISGNRLLWSHPTQRENGQFLSLNEIGGYEIRYRPNSLGNFTYINLPGSQSTQYGIGSLPSNYDFQIAVYDTQGLYSDFVSIVPRP